ncbi:2'-5' RNA ligase family protein [Longimycelium tulufanense]|uniref:2'-5' RNA ligase family protein n=1 Tax=Longimycelium tulufanense TaxID=907463 RepID=UPI0016651435|nr:2'-5' RNA ligase family protein [Longimycelium tulufanense]
MPAADPVLDRVRERYPGLVREVPAHVSVLYPFLDVDVLTPDDLTALDDIFTSQAPLDVSFATCAGHGGFVYLPPEPVEALDALSVEVQEHWPQLLPYGGAYGRPRPHLTIVMGADEPTAARVSEDVRAHLPLHATLGEAWLVVFTDHWSVHRRFRLDGR